MTERPILFGAPMVRAILAGQKTQTRRIVKPEGADHLFQFRGKTELKGADEPTGEWAWCGSSHTVTRHIRCPYGAPGDRLWVREGFSYSKGPSDLDGCAACDPVWFWADGSPEAGDWTKPKPSIHMPRWASRITLEITGVRVERLQSIGEVDATAEGVKAKPFPGPWWQGYRRMDDGELMHQQSVGAEPPDWMVEPHPMGSTKHLDLSAVDGFRSLWLSINGAGSWESDPWVWVVAFKRIIP